MKARRGGRLARATARPSSAIKETQILRDHVTRSMCKASFSSTVYPTGSEAMMHAVESVPHGRTRRRARVASVCEREGHQVVVEGLSEARQAA